MRLEGKKLGGGEAHSGQVCTSFFSSLAPSCAKHQVSSQDSQGNQGLDFTLRGIFHKASQADRIYRGFHR